MPDTLAESGRLLRPGRTCWRVLTAHRLGMAVDGAQQFAIADQMIRLARRSVTLLAWDFDPRVRLRQDRSETISDLLERQVGAHSRLEVRVLRWDMPLGLRDWLAHPRLHYRLYGDLPPGGAKHQKMLLVDDSLAMVGGMDFTGNRWDTRAHAPDDPRRRSPSGSAYEPRHDVALVVSGPVAGGLAEITRRRWREATGRDMPPVAATRHWPTGLAADMRDVAVGICRTKPTRDGRPAIRENEALHLAAIAAARRAIYLENQYLSSERIAEALARRLAEEKGPEVCLVLPRQAPTRVEAAFMDSPRADLVAKLRRADRHNRLGIYHPVNAGGRPISMHSKVQAVDDVLLRVGSTNLSRRSMGFDTELDLAVAETGDVPTREDIGALRDRLLAEHLGVPEAVLRRVTDSHGLHGAIERLRRESGRTLVPLKVGANHLPGRLISRYHFFDPAGVEEIHRPWRRSPRRRGSATRHANWIGNEQRKSAQDEISKPHLPQDT